MLLTISLENAPYFKIRMTILNFSSSLSKQQEKIIRQRMRLQRKHLFFTFRQAASLACMQQFVKHPLFNRCERIAFYCPIEGELDPHYIIEKAWQRRKECFLPVLDPLRKSLLFSEYRSQDHLKRNRYKILEPQPRLRNPIATWTLDVVFVPLLAFDLKGHRLGRGAGYYDRTFAFLKKTIKPGRPKLIGLAYEFQNTEGLIQKPWDILLDGILTEKRYICLDKSARDKL